MAAALADVAKCVVEIDKLNGDLAARFQEAVTIRLQKTVADSITKDFLVAALAVAVSMLLR